MRSMPRTATRSGRISLVTVLTRPRQLANSDWKVSLNANTKLKAIQAVEQSVRLAFAGVTLEDGVGLMQGLEIDSYAGADAEAAARETDEKEDWTRIQVEVLNGAATSPCYFDAKGMRFHLPAYLIADLRGLLTQDIRFDLNTRGLDERYSLLTAAQREAVRQFLVLQLELLPEPNLQFEGKTIRASVEGYWAHEQPPNAS